MEDSDSISLDQCFDESAPSNHLTVVGRFLCSKKVNRVAVSNVLTKVWRTEEKFTITEWGNNTFVFLFQSEIDICRIFCQGPWSVNSKILVLRKWDSSKSIEEIDFSFSPFWVQVHGLPLGFLNTKCGEIIAQKIGDVIRIEDPEREGRLEKCLRLRVWVDLKKPFKKGFNLKRAGASDLWVKLKYERLADLCYGCGLISHSVAECLRLSDKEDRSLWTYDAEIRAETSFIRTTIDFGVRPSEVYGYPAKVQASPAATRLARNKETKELVAMNYIERGDRIDENVAREIITHRSLRHPHIARFIEVLLTPTHLAIVTEHAAGGELFERVDSAGRFSEDEARYFFQQLISGVSYCHSMQICHRDLKLENSLLDGSPAPRIKISDFGYSKSSLLHWRPKSTVGTPAYNAPEVLSKREYDGKLADVWSCGVTLYVMLVGAYPFEDQQDPKNFRKTIQRIKTVNYEIPEYVHISQDCRHLLSRIFVANPARRITIKEIKSHPWFLKNLPGELTEASQAVYYREENPSFSLQSVEDIMKIVQEAKTPPVSRSIGGEEDEQKEEEEAEDKTNIRR